MLRIRAYNVLFGDCYLISWKEGNDYHHAWVDFGNFHNDKDDVFDIVYDDVLRRTDGHIDLVIISHRHRDHLDGFYTRRSRFDADRWQIDRLWSAHVTKNLDDRFRLAEQRLLGLMSEEALRGLGPLGEEFRNNVGIDTPLSVGNETRMEEIVDGLDPGEHVEVHRQMDLDVADALPPGLAEMQVEVLGPDRDSSVYLSGVSHSLGLAGPGEDPVFELSGGMPKDSDPALESQWSGLADFARLRRSMRLSDAELLSAATTTRNNTSVVAKFTYHGKSILMPGDAELEAWEVMRDAGANLSADLMKVAHHGSINASPEWGYQMVFPARRSSNKVIISTDSTRYTGPNEVPKAEVLGGWRDRLMSAGRYRTTDGLDLGASISFYYRG